MGADYKHAPMGGLRFMTSGNTVQANVNRYMGFLSSNVELDVVHIAPYDGIARHLRCWAGAVPGVGEDFTYVLRRGPLATGIMANTVLTCVTGAAVQRSDDLVNAVAFDEGDLIAVFIANSAGGAQTVHAASIQLIPI